MIIAIKPTLFFGLLLGKSKPQMIGFHYIWTNKELGKIV